MNSHTNAYKLPERLDPKLFYQSMSKQPTRDIPGEEFLRENPETGYFDCTLCETSHGNIDCFVSHVLGKKHTSNAFWREYQLMDSDPTLARLGDAALGIPREIECRGTCWFKCGICDCVFYCAETVLDHCKGRRHTNAMKNHQSAGNKAIHSIQTNRSGANDRSDFQNRGRVSPPPPFYRIETKVNSEVERVTDAIGGKPYIGRPSECASSSESPECIVPAKYHEESRSQFRSRRIIPPPPSYLPRDYTYDI